MEYYREDFTPPQPNETPANVIIPNQITFLSVPTFILSTERFCVKQNAGDLVLHFHKIEGFARDRMVKMEAAQVDISSS